MEPVLAYIDPGSGSLVIQALIAGLVAAPVIFRRQLMRIVNLMQHSKEHMMEDTALVVMRQLAYLCPPAVLPLVQRRFQVGRTRCFGGRAVVPLTPDADLLWCT